MHRKFVSALPAVVSFFCLASAAAAQDQVSLTLPQALKSAIERNLDLRAELYSPAMAEADIRKYRGIYNPKLKLNSGVNQEHILLTRSVEGENSVSRTTAATADVELATLLPFGGEIGAGFENTWNHSNGGGTIIQNGPVVGGVPQAIAITTLEDYWKSQLYVRYSQPLLKNFGRDNTEIDIRVAETEKEASLDRMRTRVLDLAADVNKQYYALHSVREDLAVKRASLALAQKVLDDTKARVKAGVLPAMEILNADYGVAVREKDVIDAERAVRDQNDLLRVLLQLEEIGEIVPAEAPPKEPFAATVDDDIKRTLENRPELKELRATIRSNELRTRNLRNLTLPDLSLEARAGLNGLGEDYGSNLDRLASAKYPAWNVGLQFVYPLGNAAAHNEYIRSKLKTEQLKTQLHSKEEAIGKEVRTAERGVSSAYKQLDVADRQRAAAEERLRAFLKKSEVGLATIKDVLEVENELTLARSNQIRAVVDYNNAITTYLRATGGLLERDRINIGVGDTDRLYTNAKD